MCYILIDYHQLPIFPLQVTSWFLHWIKIMIAWLRQKDESSHFFSCEIGIQMISENSIIMVKSWLNVANFQRSKEKWKNNSETWQYGSKIQEKVAVEMTDHFRK